MNNHWFTLHGNTFLWLKGDTGLAYNAENGRRLIFSLSDKIEVICNQLLKIENLYTVELSDESINDDEINHWIHSLIDIEAGFLSKNVNFDERPISLKPVLKVQDDRMYYENQQKLGFRGKILQNLHELTFYINGTEQGHDEYFKQDIYPVKDSQSLDKLKILSFIKNSKNYFLSNINLVGNLFSFCDYECLINEISNLSIQCTVQILIKDFLNHLQEVRDVKWPTGIRFNILVDTFFDVTYLENVTAPFSITVFVFSEDDYFQYSSMFDTFQSAQNIRFIPLYNKSNVSFFNSNVFIDNQDIDNLTLSKNEIFIRQAINIGDFGKLTIMPDGKIYANVNKPPLGTVDDSPYSIVYKEFTSGQSWFRLRTQVPCENCIYQWLCPSPSNYEIVLGQSNLCHFKQNK